MDGFEDLALKILLSVSNLAGQMAKSAKKLHNSFVEEARKVEQLLEKTQETEADKEHTARQREMDLIHLEKKLNVENNVKPKLKKQITRNVIKIK